MTDPQAPPVSADTWNAFIACVHSKGHISFNPHPSQNQITGVITDASLADITDCAASNGISQYLPTDLNSFVGKTLSDLRDSLIAGNVIPPVDPVPPLTDALGLLGAIGGFFEWLLSLDYLRILVAILAAFLVWEGYKRISGETGTTINVPRAVPVPV